MSNFDKECFCKDFRDKYIKKIIEVETGSGSFRCFLYFLKENAHPSTEDTSMFCSDAYLLFGLDPFDCEVRSAAFIDDDEQLVEKAVVWQA